MAKKRLNRISTLGARLSTTVSVSLVLLILGLILIITSLTSGAGDSLRRSMSVVVSVVPGAPQAAIDTLAEALADKPYTASLRYVSAEEVMAEEMQYNADIIKALGQNPYSAEFEVMLEPRYVDPDSLRHLLTALADMPAVGDVYSQTEAVESLNAILRKATLVLAAAGLMVLVVSIVLLFNTIHLAIYSRRFVIYTMLLVGATRGFVRRPFIVSGCLIGVFASLLASAMICLLHCCLQSMDAESMLALDWGRTAAVCGCLVVAGVAGCAFAAGCASTRYLNSSYDSLYTI